MCCFYVEWAGPLSVRSLSNFAPWEVRGALTLRAIPSEPTDKLAEVVGICKSTVMRYHSSTKRELSNQPGNR